jgi:hypothetical protein
MHGTRLLTRSKWRKCWGQHAHAGRALKPERQQLPRFQASGTHRTPHLKPASGQVAIVSRAERQRMWSQRRSRSPLSRRDRADQCGSHWRAPGPSVTQSLDHEKLVCERSACVHPSRLGVGIAPDGVAATRARGVLRVVIACLRRREMVGGHQLAQNIGCIRGSDRPVGAPVDDHARNRARVGAHGTMGCVSTCVGHAASCHRAERGPHAGRRLVGQPRVHGHRGRRGRGSTRPG